MAYDIEAAVPYSLILDAQERKVLGAVRGAASLEGQPDLTSFSDIIEPHLDP